MFQILLRRGADLQAQNNAGRTVTDVAIDDVEEFLNSKFESSPNRFLRKPIYDFYRAAQLSLYVGVHYLLALLLLLNVGWISAISAFAAGIYLWKHFHLCPGSDEQSIVWPSVFFYSVTGNLLCYYVYFGAPSFSTHYFFILYFNILF